MKVCEVAQGGLPQLVFFLLFLFLLLRTELRGSLHATGSEIALPYPVRLFFQIDPLEW